VLAAPRAPSWTATATLLAENVAGYVFADPSRWSRPQATRCGCATCSACSVGDLLPSSAARSGRTHKDEFEYLARGVTPQVGDSVMALDLPGIGVSAASRRYCPATTSRRT